ncbi:MAG: phosphoheptose isomerase [Gammaproteobacteria bacterium GWF2_41_13]|nr:MAG: phosphoheptose isomerase [Gammaproteobacteria bacterium GWF2_41_13]
MTTNLLERVTQHFEESVQVKTKAAPLLAPIILEASHTLANSLKKGHKILICGNGGSAADAQHFSGELLNQLELKRPSLPGITLTADASTITAIGNDYSFDEVFAKQVHALGQAGDVLVGITTSGNSKNVLRAIEEAHTRGLSVIALTGRDGGKIPAILQANDIEIRIPSDRTIRIQEIHILVIHCLCDLIDQQL